MRRVNKLISIAVLACFLVNTAIADRAFALGTAPASVDPEKRDSICETALDGLASKHPLAIDLDINIPIKSWTMADLPKGNVIMSNRELPSDQSCAPFNVAPMIHDKKILLVTLEPGDMALIEPALHELCNPSLGNSLTHIMPALADIRSVDVLAATLREAIEDADIILFPNASMMDPGTSKFPTDLHELFRQASRIYGERKSGEVVPMYYDAPSVPILANVFIPMGEKAYERADEAMARHLTQTDRTDYRKVLKHLLRFWREVGKATGKLKGKEWYATPFVVTDKSGKRIDPAILKDRRAKAPMIVMIPHQDDSELSAIARILQRLDQADEGDVAVEIWAMGPGNGGVPTVTDAMIKEVMPVFRAMYPNEGAFVARFGERYARNQKILDELREMADDVPGFIKKYESEYKDFPEILAKLKALDKASIEKVINGQGDKLRLFKDPGTTYRRMLLASSGDMPTGQELEELKEVVRYVIRYPELENAQKVLQSEIDGYKPNGRIKVRMLSSDLLTYSSSIPRVPALNALFAGFADETASMLDEFCRDYKAEIIYDQAHGVPIEIVGPHPRDAHANHVATADAMTAALPIFAERHPELNYEPWRYLAVWAGDPPGTKNIYVACPAEWNGEEILASPWKKAAYHFSMLMSPLVGELAASRFGLKSQNTSAFVINRLFAEAGAIEPPPALIAPPVTVAPVARKKLTVEKTQKRALVTGGAGYLGSILTRYLMTQGVDVWVIDDESTGHAQAVPEEIVASGRYVKGDINDTAQLTKMIQDNNIDVVYHLAAKTLMGDSVETPALYNYTNAIGTLSVAEAIKTAQEKTGRRVVLFNTSTCGVFDDEAIELKQGKGLSEKSSVRPTAPYTETKLTAERILEHYQREYDVEYVSIRPFNIVGAHQTPDGQWWGEDTGHATHLITVAGNVVTGKRAAQGIFGNDFDTSSSPAEAKLSPERMANFGVDRDGTGIREYIHADDICELGFAYVNYVLRCVNSEEPVTERVLGGGTGIPLSALKVLGDYVFPIAIELGIRADNPPTIIEPRRDGDDATKTLDTTLQKSLLSIEAQGSIDYIVRSHLMFITTRPNGYEDDKSGYGDISENEALEKTMRALDVATNLSEDVKKDMKYRLMTDLVIAAITCSGPLDTDTLMARKDQRKAMQVTRGNLLRDKEFHVAIKEPAMRKEFEKSVEMADNTGMLELALKVCEDLNLTKYRTILREKLRKGTADEMESADADEEMVTVDGFRVPARIMNVFDERKVKAIGTIVGVPTEIKPQAERVGLTPKGVKMLVYHGVRVIVQRGAGRQHFSDTEYQEVGAEMVDTAEEIWARSTIIKKVKEPLGPELELMKPGQTIFTYLHLASPELKELTGKLVEKSITGIAYETVRDEKGGTPMLKPMSIIAGDLGGLYGALYSNEGYVNNKNGKIELSEDGASALALMKSKYPNMDPSDIAKDKIAIVLGGGISGERMAVRLLDQGANVTVTDINEGRLSELRKIFERYGERFTAINPGKDINKPVPELLEKYKAADILGGCILLPGGVAPQMSKDLLEEISKDHPKIIVDIALDQGGNFFGSYSRHYDDPVFLDDFGNKRFCVPNMPDAVGKIASIELEKTNIAYTLALAMGLDEALKICPELRDGINTNAGAITYDKVASEYPELPHRSVDTVSVAPTSQATPVNLDMATGELEDIFRSTELLRQGEPVEIFIQQGVGIDDTVRKQIADVNINYKESGRSPEDLIVCHIFGHEGDLAKLLKNRPAGRRIIVTSRHQLYIEKFSADERSSGPQGLFNNTRLISVELPYGYNAMSRPEKAFYQAWAINVAIYGRIIDRDSPLYLKTTLENMLKGSVDGDVGDFMDNLVKPDSEWVNPGGRIAYFLSRMVYLSKQVAKDYELLKLRMKAFWTAA